MQESRQYRRVSADSHLSLPSDFFRTYLAEAWREHDWVKAAERMDRASLKRAGMALAHNAGKRFEEMTSEGVTLDDIRPGANEPVARLADMDRDGVDAEVLYCPGNVPTVGPAVDEALQRALVRGYNSYFSDFSAEDPSRLIGLATIPLQNLALAEEEMRRTADLPGIRGFLFDAFPTLPLWDRAYERLWSVAVEVGRPIHFHIRGRPSATFSGVDPGVPDPTGVPLAWISLVNTSVLETLAIVVITGVLERHSDLVVVFAETSVSWLPYFKERMDQIVERHRHWSGCRLAEKPSTYVEQQCRFTFIEDRTGVRLRDQVGVANMMWSNDYPHADSTWPHSDRYIEELFAGVGDEDRDRILAGNAVELYRLAT